MEILAMLVFVPLIVFLVVVAPIWIVFHYISKRKLTGQLSDSEREELHSLAQQATVMAERINTLEAILDSQAPDWQKRSGEDQ